MNRRKYLIDYATWFTRLSGVTPRTNGVSVPAPILHFNLATWRARLSGVARRAA
jgi:hypothetical protein